MVSHDEACLDLSKNKKRFGHTDLDDLLDTAACGSAVEVGYLDEPAACPPEVGSADEVGYLDDEVEVVGWKCVCPS